MNIRQLEYFVAVADAQSFTKASKHLFVSQSALSQQVKALEREMGVRLFDRDRRSVALTASGTAFLEDARALLSRTSDALKRAREASRGPEGELKVGYIKGYERTDLPDMLFDFHTRYPSVRLSFLRENVAELYDALREEKIDLAVNLLYGEGGSDMEGIECQFLRSYPLNAVVPSMHPLAHRTHVSMADLAGFPLVDIHKGTGGYGEHDRISQTLAETGGEPPIVYVSEDVETSVLAVAAGMGYALLPGYFTDAIPTGGKVVVLPIDGKETEMRVCAAWLPERKNELLDVFLDEFLRVGEGNVRHSPVSPFPGDLGQR